MYLWLIWEVVNLVLFLIPFLFFCFLSPKSLWSGISQKLQNTGINLRCFGRATEQVFQSLLARKHVLLPKWTTVAQNHWVVLTCHSQLYGVSSEHIRCFNAYKRCKPFWFYDTNTFFGMIAYWYDKPKIYLPSHLRWVQQTRVGCPDCTRQLYIVNISPVSKYYENIEQNTIEH